MKQQILVGFLLLVHYNYPCYFIEKACESTSLVYLLPKNLLPFIEGLAAGGIIYSINGEKEAFLYGPIVTATIRHFQGLSYVSKNLKHFKNIKRKDREDR